MNRRFFVGAAAGLLATESVRAQAAASEDAVEEDVPREILKMGHGPQPEPLEFCPPDTSVGYSDASLIQLLASPAAHHRKRVKVLGFLNLEFEGNALYLNREAYDAANMQLSIRLGVRMDDVAHVRKKLNHHYVEIEGTFEFMPNEWPTGVLQEIRAIENWPSRRDFQRAVRGRPLPYAHFACPNGDG